MMPSSKEGSHLTMAPILTFSSNSRYFGRKPRASVRKFITPASCLSVAALLATAGITGCGSSDPFSPPACASFPTQAVKNSIASLGSIADYSLDERRNLHFGDRGELPLVSRSDNYVCAWPSSQGDSDDARALSATITTILTSHVAPIGQSRAAIAGVKKYTPDLPGSGWIWTDTETDTVEVQWFCTSQDFADKSVNVQFSISTPLHPQSPQTDVDTLLTGIYPLLDCAATTTSDQTRTPQSS